MKKDRKHQRQNNPSSVQSHVRDFFTNCSLRGVSKAYKTNSIIIKSVWIIFIVIMLILLLYSIINILREYLEYNTTIQTKLQIEDASPFPAITICPYQPFSHRAVKFFKNKGMSPKNFSQKLRASAKTYLQNNDPGRAEIILFYDDLRIYYQNLKYEDSLQIGLKEKEIFIFCITKLKMGMFFGQVDSNCGYNISRYSSPEFFNCFTIKMKPQYLKATEYIYLILQFPNPKELDDFREISLIRSLSQNIIGAQLLVHQSNSAPTSTKEKIHIEPNRLLQINYQNNLWKEYSTPTDICVTETDDLQNVVDLDNKYSFTFQGCLESYNARRILEKCKCVIAALPRPVIPSLENPYCGNFGNLTEDGFRKFWNSHGCASKVLKALERMSSSEKGCYKKCEDQRFNLQISNINWKPNLWQLEWLFKLQESWNILIDDPKNNSERDNAKRLALKFLNANTLSDLNMINETTIFHKDEKYACVVLERLSNETFHKEERLGLSLYGLVSRIGGSCTLYLGLTCGFIIEVIEFMVIVSENKAKEKKNYKQKKSAGQYNSDTQMINEKDLCLTSDIELNNDTPHNKT